MRSRRIPKLSDQGLAALDTVATKLDVPAGVVALLKGENATIEAIADPVLVNEADLLKLRIDALL